MAQIGFTHKTEPVYDRFERMRRAYEDAHGRTYAPGFLTVLMDGFTNVTHGNIEAFALKLATGIVDTQINTAKKVKEGLVNPDHIDPDMLADDWAMWIEQQFEEFIKPKAE